MRSPAVLIMARAPRAGAVKTRLQPRLGPDGCARLQAALIEHTVLLACQVFPDATYLALDGPYAADSRARPLSQRGADLGARMHNAVMDVWAAHGGPVLVVGTDAPTLRERHLRAAATALVAGTDVVFGPALDGGYYLVGLREPAVAAVVLSIDARLWGGPDVLAASLTAVERAGLGADLLELLRDLDTPIDAYSLLAGGGLPAEVARLLVATGAPT